MAESDDARLLEIDDAFVQTGFKRDWAAPTLSYRGSLFCGGRDIPVVVTVPDTDFIRLPKVVLSDPDELPDAVLPHLLSVSGELCYLEKTTTVLDRYRPGGTVLRCLQRAQIVLNDALAGNSNADIAEEFYAYWGGITYVDLPESRESQNVLLYWLALSAEDPEKLTAVFAARKRLAKSLSAIHEKNMPGRKPRTDPCIVMDIDQPLTVIGNRSIWPPATLSAMIAWLSHFTADPYTVIAKALDNKSSGPWWIVLNAANGKFVFSISLPEAFRTQEFTDNRRSTLVNSLLRIAAQVQIDRYAGFPIDAIYIFNRNIDGMTGLKDKNILLIGCGTIGSYLAHQLVQSGAGTGVDGKLTLVDSDVLETSNIGRHLLGLPYLKMNKAFACSKFLESQIPHIKISAKSENAMNLQATFENYDLIIEATGEEAFSIALNHVAVNKRPKFPPVLHVWLVGNGAAVQAIMTGDEKYACYKCLKPDLSAEPRHRILKSETRLVRNLACGDATYIPFPVSRSVQAAALGLEMVLDWVNGKPRPYFRNRIFDENKAFNVKDSNPDRTVLCPACSPQ